MITLYKGDDTGGQLGKNVKIMFHCDDAVDMDDVVVKFDLLGIVKREFTDVHDGDVLDIFISHAESRKFPLGVIFAKMWGEDASGKLRTFANRIPFRVTLNLIAVYGSDGTDSQDIHVYSSVDWDSIANKPTVFPSSIGEVEGLQEALDEINEKIPFDASADNQLADKEWVDQEIDRVAAYYITSDAQGNPFRTRAALLNAETYYSGGSPRTPTRNDYAIVLADESHDNTEWRYIYSENDQGVGVWEAQYPVEGVMTVDQSVTKDSPNPVSGGGVWSALWGMATTAFSSVYDWCVAQLAIKRDYTDRSYNTQVTVNAPALHAILTSRGTQILEYYLPCTEDIPATPEINHVYTWRRDGAEFYITQGVSALTTIWTLYDSAGEQLARTTTDNATQGYFPDLTFETSAYAAVTSTKVNSYPDEVQDALALNSNVPAASTTLPKMDSPNAAVIGTPGKYACSDHVHPTDTSRMAATATGADIPLNPSPGAPNLNSVVNTLTTQISSHENNTTIHVTAEDKATWNGKQDALTAQQLANIAAVPDKLDKSGGTVTGTLTLLDTLFLKSDPYSNGIEINTYGWIGYNNLTALYLDSLILAYNYNDHCRFKMELADGTYAELANTADLLAKLDSTSAAPAFSTSSTYAVGEHVTYNGALYRCTTAVTTTGAWDANKWTADTMTDPDAVLDITAQNQLRVVSKDGTVLWAQGYDLASTSSATLACDATNNFTFADGATTQAFTLPTAPTGKVGDFGLDIDNSANTGAATISFTNIANNTASVVIPEGENLNDMLAIAAGELARFYISLSTFRVNNLPTWHIVKQVVENGGAQS